MPAAAAAFGLSKGIIRTCPGVLRMYVSIFVRPLCMLVGISHLFLTLNSIIIHSSAALCPVKMGMSFVALSCPLPLHLSLSLIWLGLHARFCLSFSLRQLPHSLGLAPHNMFFVCSYIQLIVFVTLSPSWLLAFLSVSVSNGSPAFSFLYHAFAACLGDIWPLLYFACL